ncbi:MAG: hypothetical protein WC782_07070 [Methylococcaceae bacterium]|jgi:uncharacterized low-complexity protein
MKKLNKTPFAAAMGTAFISTLAMTAVQADTNPFGMTELSGGYMQVAEASKTPGVKEGSCGEGKCGANMKKGTSSKIDEGTCASSKAGTEAKCGEGKCGESKCGAMMENGKMKKGMEGKCGEMMKGKEGACGEMKDTAKPKVEAAPSK